MRELDRDSSHSAPLDARPGAVSLAGRELAIVGAGRVGRALVPSLRAAGLRVSGPLGRGSDGGGADVVLLCVPDAEIAAAAADLAPGPMLGHCSGATGLEALGERGGFSMHPLMTVTGEDSSLDGAGCAIDGTGEPERETARALAAALGMRPVRVDPADRPAYHAAASIASNYLVTLEAAAERLAASAGIGRAELAPLVRAAVESWARLGGERALTGPLARGDERTVARQREAVAERAPDLLPLFDALARATRALAGRTAAAGPAAPVRTIADLRTALEPPRRAGMTVGLVPTMGAFHAGHRSLMRAARSRCDVVVVSLFVNPAQFGAGEDLATYPRDEARDLAIAAEEGADLVFAPPVEQIYPDGFATTVSVRGPLAETLEGAARPGHFDGVATVVAKLLAIARPDVAFFGAKDFQQALLVRRLAADLDLGARIEVLPTVREPDGLAASSRNARLGPGDRERAPALRRGLEAAREAIAGGERSAERAAERGRAAMAELGVEAEYFAIVSPESLEPVDPIDAEVLVAVAARVGPARLIDNELIDPARARGPEPESTVEREAATR